MMNPNFAGTFAPDGPRTAHHRHRRTNSIDNTHFHYRNSSSDVSNLSLTSLNSALTPPQSPRAYHKSSPVFSAPSGVHKNSSGQIDLDEITKHHLDYRQRLCSSQITRKPSVSSIMEFPECNVYDMSDNDSSGDDEVPLQDVLRSQNRSPSKEPFYVCELPDTSHQLISKFDKPEMKSSRRFSLLRGLKR